jgi:ribosomal protein S18 acetylase RimI-like enzyme
MQTIRDMIVADLENVISIHMNSFQGFFLSFLGKKFLKLFYEGIISSPQGVGLIYVSDGHIQGFICGSVDPSDFFRNLLKKKWIQFAFASLGAVLKKPSIIPRLLRAVNQPSSSPKGKDNATLMSIGVDPNAQGLGIGKILVQHFLEKLRAIGAQEVNLTTDRLNNAKTNEFYQKLGFSLKRHFVTPEGREMNEYIIQL